MRVGFIFRKSMCALHDSHPTAQEYYGFTERRSLEIPVDGHKHVLPLPHTPKARVRTLHSTLLVTLSGL